MRSLVTILQNILPAFLLLATLSAAAQFKGGAGEGTVLATALNTQSLGISIYHGGVDDGFTLNAPANTLALGLSIFHGGIDDGFALSASANTQSLGLSIFHGGVDDGFTLAAPASTQNLGLSIFHGSVDDGFTVSAPANAQSLGLSIFTGGPNDGWAVALVTNTALPVTLMSFTAKWQQEDVLVNWKTSIESNTDHFEIERSADGLHFTSIGSTAAAGNSSTEKDYQYLDKKVNKNYTVVPSKLYYRLKTVDKDGQVSYSAVVIINNDTTGNTTVYTLYPNPANQQLVIETQGPFRQYVMTLLTGTQQLLLQKKVTDQKEIVSVGRYPSGMYYVVITDTINKTTQTFKILIQH